jgi:DNA-binding response OmpR family regulator
MFPRDQSRRLLQRLRDHSGEHLTEQPNLIYKDKWHSIFSQTDLSTSMPKILLIEDDKTLSTLIAQFLAVRKFDVDAVLDGEEGLNWLRNQQYGVAVIDWDVPSINGVEICRQFRESGGNTPILMLTKRSQVADKISGITAGADDYLPKPFDMDELYIRLVALMRRAPEVKPSLLRAGQLTVDSTQRVASVCGQPIELSRKEFAILELLIANPGRVYSGESILEKLWSTERDTTMWAVRTHVARVRSKIAAVDSETASLIKTLYGQGYKLELPPA